MKHLLLICCLLPAAFLQADIRDQLATIDDIRVKSIETRDGFLQSFEIFITQPLDHSAPDSGFFEQRLYLDHVDAMQPVVFITEGYQIGGHVRSELCDLLNANQLRVEHRYFGESAPDSMNWQYLTVKQSVEDLHKIAGLFKKVYSGKWISTGISKGGQTTLFYKRFYPNDVDVAIPMVAPIPLAVEDSRLDEHLATVGNEACREKIKAFQRNVLEKRDAMLPLFETWAIEKNEVFPDGAEVALEYTVLEYSFSFWQWGRWRCDQIPDENATADEMFSHLEKMNIFGLYTKDGIATYEPFFYQAMTELGYYGFVHDHLEDLLEAVSEPTNAIFAPQDADLTYRPEVMQDIHSWLVNEGNNILYIHGELDTWTGAGVIPSEGTNALRMVNPGGYHDTRINSFPPQMRQEIYGVLSRWLEKEVNESFFKRNFMLVNSLYMFAILAFTLLLVYRRIQAGKNA